MFKAFDYQAQQWLEGESARQLLIAQNEQTLALLRSDKGAEFARFERRPQHEMISEIIRTLRQLKAKAPLRFPGHGYNRGINYLEWYVINWTPDKSEYESVTLRFCPRGAVNWVIKSDLGAPGFKPATRGQILAAVKGDVRERRVVLTTGEADVYNKHMAGVFHVDGERVDEFSREACHCCDTRLAGERFKAVQWHDNGYQEHVVICVDCLDEHCS